MSTNRQARGTADRRAMRTARRGKRFRFGVLAVVATLFVVVVGGSVIALNLGPRVTDVQVDPRSAIETGGGRVLITADQAVAPISEDQVQIEPAAQFTVESAGRTIGVRFTAPLDDEQTYTVQINEVQSLGGGPPSVLETAFATPSAALFTLVRADGESTDRIIRQTVDGDGSEVVFEHARIDDFRATSDRLVVSVMENGLSRLLVMRLDGGDARQLELPGVGTIAGLQVSDRGDLLGYTYTDRDVLEDEGLASVLYTASIRDTEAAPESLVVGGEQPSIAQWRFVPDSSALVLINFDGALITIDPEVEDPDPVLLGDAVMIDSISRGTYTAIIETLDEGVVVWDLVSGQREPLAVADGEGGVDRHALQLPDGSTVRQVITYDELVPTDQTVAHVSVDGELTPLLTVDSADSLLQTCASPSGRYIAATVVPDIATNPYDASDLQPIPRVVETHIIDLREGGVRSILPGFDVSWCEVGPWAFA